jgi:hypothetical protein
MVCMSLGITKSSMGETLDAYIHVQDSDVLKHRNDNIHSIRLKDAQTSLDFVTQR